MGQSVRKKSAFLGIAICVLVAGCSIAFAQQSTPSPAASPTPSSNDVHARVTETLIDSSIPDDPALDQMLSVYAPKVHALDDIIGELKGELRKSGMGGGSLGNFVADALRARASLAHGTPVDLALINGGGLRRPNITEGHLRPSDIFELLPFENAVVTLDLTGVQLLKLLAVVASTHDAQSGALITYITQADRTSHLEKAVLVDAAGHEKQIDPQTTYAVATIDYLYNVGGRYSMLREGQNMKPSGITLRDAVIDYVKAQTAAKRDIKPNLDERFILDKANSVVIDERRPQ